VPAELRQQGEAGDKGYFMDPNIPKVGDWGDTRLPAVSLRYRRIASVVTTVILIAIVMAIVLFIDNATATWLWLVVFLPALIVFELVSVIVLEHYAYKNYSYSVARDYIYITYGRIIRKATLFSIYKVLNTETVQGPVLARFGLVNLKLNCVVQTEEIGPITPEAAELIQSAILSSQNATHDAHDARDSAERADDAVS
jgi:membrane protein YdbS with pleckstrin-like domain